VGGSRQASGRCQRGQRCAPRRGTAAQAPQGYGVADGGGPAIAWCFVLPEEGGWGAAADMRASSDARKKKSAGMTWRKGLCVGGSEEGAAGDYGFD